jgi:hypothetical protein
MNLVAHEFDGVAAQLDQRYISDGDLDIRVTTEDHITLVLPRMNTGVAYADPNAVEKPSGLFLAELFGHVGSFPPGGWNFLP